MPVKQMHPVLMFTSGDSRALMTIRFSPEQLAERYGLDFEDGFDSLDHYKLAAIELPSGAQAWLMRYRGNPVPGTVVYVDAGADLSNAKSMVMQVLGLAEDDLTWKSPILSAANDLGDQSLGATAAG